MFSKAQLIEKGKHYFDDKSINVMFATSDGNFFYEASKSYADSHSKTKKIELFEIKRADLKVKAEVPAEKEDVEKQPEEAPKEEKKNTKGKNK